MSRWIGRTVLARNAGVRVLVGVLDSAQNFLLSGALKKLLFRKTLAQILIYRVVALIVLFHWTSPYRAQLLNSRKSFRKTLAPISNVADCISIEQQVATGCGASSPVSLDEERGTVTSSKSVQSVDYLFADLDNMEVLRRVY